MKKLLFVLFTLSVIAFAACSNDDAYTETSGMDGTEVNDSAMQIVQRNLELSKLQCSLQDYNAIYFGEQSPETRGWFKNFFKKALACLATIGADALGGVLGGVAGGITASGIVGGAIAFKVHRLVITPFGNTRASIGDSPFDVLNDSTLYLSLVVPDGIYGENDSIGYYHNKVLSGVFGNPVRLKAYSELSEQEQAQVLVTEMKKVPYLRDYYGKDIDDPEKVNIGINVADVIMKIADEVETEEEFFARLKDAGLTDENVISVMKEVLEGLGNLDVETDDGQYYQEVLNIIADSNLDDATKLRLSDGVIIGQASNRLWSLSDPVLAGE